MSYAFSVPQSSRQYKYNNAPGPGQYNPETSPKHVSKADPKYRYIEMLWEVLEKWKEGRILARFQDQAPMNIRNLQSRRQKKPSYSLGGRTSVVKENVNVSPGQYEPSYNYSKEKSPSFSLSGKEKPQSGKYNVGPGQYEIKGKIESNKSGYHFSKDKRELIDKRRVPGPGSYEYTGGEKKYGSQTNPSYGFGMKVSGVRGLDVPGPGQYQENQKVYSKIGGIMSRQMKNSSPLSKTPGPGTYEPKITDPKGKITFGKDNKLKKDDTKNPGPGQYEIKPKFADLPKYALAGK